MPCTACARPSRDHHESGHRLVDLLLWPQSKGRLQTSRDVPGHPTELQCQADLLGDPIRAGIPVMMLGEARTLDDSPAPARSPS